MIATTLVLSFLLSLLPLVIGTLSFRHAANFYSRGILALSAVGCILGLLQFSLLLGLSYRLFPAAFTAHVPPALQYINITGGIVMIVAGLLWIGYFRALRSRTAPAPRQAATPAEPQLQPVKPLRSRRPKAAPSADWFTDELLPPPTVRLAAEIAPKKPSRSKTMTPRKKKPDSAQ